jgi:hypothetical protein
LSQLALKQTPETISAKLHILFLLKCSDISQPMQGSFIKEMLNQQQQKKGLFLKRSG